ncbi:glyoxalase superfamily protein [Paenibacillus hodogayensis]|uniref:Glyoxalase superfamily protein n=1 Tax=Paenibacillus hodogayensis TaxID=279208 RepID=A0ABV5VW47_9BACL
MQVNNLAGYHAKLLGKQFKYARPGIETTPWKTREVSIQDPAGNRIHFYENL